MGSKKCSLHLDRSPPFLGFENPLQETSETRFGRGGVVRLSSTRRGGGGGSYERRPPTRREGRGVVDLFGSGSRRRVAKHRKSMKKRKKGLEEKGENAEMHLKNREKHEEKKERSRGKRGKRGKALRNRNLQKCKLHFGTPLSRWYVPRH